GGIFGHHRLSAAPQGQVGTGQVSGATEQLGQQRTEEIQAVLAGLAAGDVLALLRYLADEGTGLLLEVRRQLTGHAALELGSQLGEFGLVGSELLVPLLLGTGTGFAGVPLGVDVFGDLDGTMLPAQRLAGPRDPVLTQGCAVGGFLALLVRRAEADDGLAADQGRPVALASSLDGQPDLVGIVAVDVADHLPAVGLEAPRGIVGEPAMHFTIDGNAVV